MAALSVLGIAAVLLVVLFSVKRREVNSVQEAGNGTESVPAVQDESQEIVREVITFDDSQMHTGDMILVNGSYPYDFEANAASVDLVNIRQTQGLYYQVGKIEFEVARRIMPHLDELVAACDAAVGTKLTGVASAYRTKEYQQNVWSEMEQLYGLEYAQKYVAVPGYSEHHTGLAVDMSIFYEDGSEGTFSESENAVWMNGNAWHYGFVRRYAEDKVSVTGISNEAWHFRYVGFPHAAYMYEKNLCLEEYIDFLRTNTTEENPLLTTCETGTFKVFFTREKEIEKPEGEYQVSGNNVDGYIVTVRV